MVLDSSKRRGRWCRRIHSRTLLNTGADDDAAQCSPSPFDRSAERAERREPRGAACWWNQFGDNFTMSRDCNRFTGLDAVKQIFQLSTRFFDVDTCHESLKL